MAKLTDEQVDAIVSDIDDLKSIHGVKAAILVQVLEMIGTYEVTKMLPQEDCKLLLERVLALSEIPLPAVVASARLAQRHLQTFFKTARK